ncbi:MAG: hypothetical protein HYR60_09530, partial [Acidobacteria bacterium]|nr:hypothetical protein [Acidobacteriota bacterium]
MPNEIEACVEWDQILAGQKLAVREQLLGTWQGQVASLGQQLLGQFQERVDQLLDDQFGHLTRQLAEQVADEVDRAVAGAQRAERRRLGEELNQTVRRLRAVSSVEEVARWLLDASSAFCPRAAVFGVHGLFLQGLCVRGVESEPALSLFDAMDLPLEDARAFAQAAGGRDPVITAATPAELSQAVCDVFHHAPSEKVCLFPILVRNEAAAILYAAPGEEAVEVGLLELLSQIAASAAEALVPETAAPAPSAGNLIQIDGAGVRRPGAGWSVQPPEWSSLSREEQDLHLLARRFARVHVAEMRLYHGDQVEAGRGAHKLYGALREPIDAARETFRQKFICASSTMVDYFHLELVR